LLRKFRGRSEDTYRNIFKPGYELPGALWDTQRKPRNQNQNSDKPNLNIKEVEHERKGQTRSKEILVENFKSWGADRLMVAGCGAQLTLQAVKQPAEIAKLTAPAVLKGTTIKSVILRPG
jgi:hypothetical protein